ncbi:unnamed protein product [Nippostrongylus brasiliensis]|uniref:Lipoprotein n=1 Tax=Nippostrongylus brasiliensis TaxID=27835 RepID=A0A0N4Y4T1_NIPBR|nr:unnamed protein product [Nippostrongylus brasiliensis]
MKSIACLLLLATVSSCLKLPWGPNCRSGNYYTGKEHELPKDIATAIQKNSKAKAMLGDYVRLKLTGNPATVEELDYKEYKKYTHCKAA